MYSQNNEQQIITDYFSPNVMGNGGKFIDIGAYDPFKFSNTRALYERGWNGIYVEPSPICFKRFQDTYKDDMRIHLINSAIGKDGGAIEFYEANGDAISTTSLSHKAKWEANPNVSYTKIIVPSISMQSFMSMHGMGVDFLSLDTEGTNYELFSLLPDYFLHRLKMICIEHDNQHLSMMSKLSSFGFKQLLINNENLIAAK